MSPDLVCIESGAPGAAAVVLVRGYLNNGAGKRRGRWLAALRHAGFRGKIFEFCWDASSRSRFAINVIGFRDWRALEARAEHLGRFVLPDLINTRLPDGVVVVGASAGARVVCQALVSGRLRQGRVSDAILLGGALQRNRDEDFSLAVQALSGRLVNVFSRRDTVLSSLYRLASRGALPCGTGPIIATESRVVNIDATRVVRGGLLHLAAHGRYPLALVAGMVRAAGDSPA